MIREIRVCDFCGEEDEYALTLHLEEAKIFLDQEYLLEPRTGKPAHLCGNCSSSFREQPAKRWEMLLKVSKVV